MMINNMIVVINITTTKYWIAFLNWKQLRLKIYYKNNII